MVGNFKSFFEKINNICQINGLEKIVNLFIIDKFTSDKTLLLCTKTGVVKQTLLSDFQVSRYSKAVRGMKIADGDSLIAVDMTDEPREIIIA